MLPAKPVLRTADLTSQDFSNNFTTIILKYETGQTFWRQPEPSSISYTVYNVHSVRCTQCTLYTVQFQDKCTQARNWSDHIGGTHPLTDAGHAERRLRPILRIS